MPDRRYRAISETRLKDFNDQFHIDAIRSAAPAARTRIRDAAAEAGLSCDALCDLEVAVGEAISNAILYGSMETGAHVRVRCWGSEDLDTFCVEITDTGAGFNPADFASPACSEDIGGRGLSIMRALVDDLQIQYNGHGMVVTLTKHG